MRSRAFVVAFALVAAVLASTPTGPAARSGTSSDAAARPPAPVRTAATGPLAARSCARPGGTLVAYGHSYLHSPQIGGATSSYAALAASALGAQPVIRAIDRGTTAGIERLVSQGPTRWQPGSAPLVLIDSGINDIGRRVPTAQWTAALTRTLQSFTPAPVPTILLVRPLPVARAGHPGRDPRVIEAYAAAQRAVAARFSAVRIVDAGAGWNPREALSRDGVHPNDAGMRHLAGAVQNTWLRTCRP